MQKILLAEDDPNLGDILKDYLELKGKFEVVLCKDGDEAMRQFNRDVFDLCILDVMMPRKDGFTLGRDIRKVNPDIPIIFATAKGMMEDKGRQCCRTGCIQVPEVGSRRPEVAGLDATS